MSEGGAQESYREKIRPTSWPEALPMEDETHFLALSVGNSNISWCWYNGPGSADGNKYGLCMAWSTPHVSVEAISKRGATKVLVTHISTKVVDTIFDGEVGTKEAAEAAATKRTSYLFTVYIMTTNLLQAERVAYLMKGLPFRVFLLKPNDFYTESQGRYQGMGMDRMAASRAAVVLHGSPALVIDGGTCSTYTAVDKNGKIAGGGIGLGVMRKCVAITNVMSSAVTYQEVWERIQEIVDTKKKVDVFARDTCSAVAVQILQELTLSGRNLIDSYFDTMGYMKPEVQASGGSSSEGQKARLKPKVCLTGGDGEILSKLLRRDAPYFPQAAPPKYDYDIFYDRTLPMVGIAAALRNKNCDLADNREPSSIARLLIGKRISDKEGERATVYAVPAGAHDNKKFIVRYDDGEVKTLTIKEVYDGLKHYYTHGESSDPTWRPSALVREKTARREREANQAALALEEDKSLKLVPGKKPKPVPVVNSATAPVAVAPKVARARVPDTTAAPPAAATTAAPQQKAATAAWKAPTPQPTTAKPPPPVAVPAAALAAATTAAAQQKAATAAWKAPTPQPTTAKPPPLVAVPAPSTNQKDERKRPAEVSDNSAKAPPAKKASVKKFDGRDWVGLRIAKEFFPDSGQVDKLALFFGTITNYAKDSEGEDWFVQYDDDDSEWMQKPEILDLWNRHQYALKHSDPQLKKNNRQKK